MSDNSANSDHNATWMVGTSVLAMGMVIGAATEARGGLQSRATALSWRGRARGGVPTCDPSSVTDKLE